MKLSSFFKAWGLAALLLLPVSQAGTPIIDVDADGLDDVWEHEFGFDTDGGDPIPAQAALADPDHDGRTNLEESQAGTNPWSGEQPDGFFQAHADWSKTEAGAFAVGWQGVEGKVYQLYASPDLGANWIEYGERVEGTGGPIEFNLPGEDLPAAQRFFWRLETVAQDSDGDGLDDEADLYPLDRYDGHRPLLLIAGEWTVKTTDAAGDPAADIGIEFRKWPAGAAEPEETLLSTGHTAGNGCLTFNPEALATGDRVVAKLAGNAQQRVYLPWKPGSEVVDASPTPGGTGWSSSVLQGLLGNGYGVGDEPHLSHPGSESSSGPGTGSIALFRFADLINVNYHFESVYSHPKDDGTGQEDDPPWTRDIVYDGDGVLGGDPTTGERENDEPFHFSSSGPPLVELGSLDVTAAYEGFPKTLSVWKTVRNIGSTLTADLGGVGLLKFQKNIYDVQNRTDDGNPQLDIFRIEDAENLSLADQDETSFGFAADASGAAESWAISHAPADGSSKSSAAESLKLIIGPVLCNAPKEVLLGLEPFTFEIIDRVDLYAELPAGIMSGRNVKWSAKILREDSNVDIWLKNPAPPYNTSSSVGDEVNLTGGISVVAVQFSGGSGLQAGDKIQVRISAEISGASELTEEEAQLGYFDTTLEYRDPADRAAEDASTSQGKELGGDLHGPGDAAAPGSANFQGGQMTQTLGAERKIGMSGLPEPGASTFVDALTKRFHHGEVDFQLAVPASDLVLSVGRSTSESIWTRASGLRPDENPLSAFGPGWTSNLNAGAVRSRPILPTGVTPGYVMGHVQVSDYLGASYGFTEVKDGVGSKFLADPTLLPDRANSGITLEVVDGDLVLTQPLLGIVHHYQAAGLTFTLPNNRDVPGAGGASLQAYYRIGTVTDRFGNSLEWIYNLSGSATGKLIPDAIQVAGREALKLRFQQEDGRVVAFWDPAGVKHSYEYAAGPSGSGVSVLKTCSIGPRVLANYGYQFATEGDPRPAEMRLPLVSAPTSFYTIPTFHLAVNRFEDGAGNATEVSFGLSQVRQAYSNAAEAYYYVAGDPMTVASIDPPGSGRTITFGGLHRLKPAAGSTPAEMTIVTNVSDLWGHDWVYNWEQPQVLTWTPHLPSLPDASALFFPSLTRSCTDLDNSSVTYRYDATAGYSLAEAEDAGGRKSSVSYGVIVNSGSPAYETPTVLVGVDHVAVNSRAVEPSATKDVRGFETQYAYTEEERLPLIITDHLGRFTEISYGSPALVSEIVLWSGRKEGSHSRDLLSKTTVSYHPVLHALPVKVVRENTGVFASDDPEWVAPLVTTVQIDAAGLGWPVKTGYDGNDDGDLDDPGDMADEATLDVCGRLLEMRSTNGGKRSFAYDAAGLLESICYEDGARVSFEYDRAGRVALARDPLGNASGTVYDVLGRVVKTIRDVEGGTALSFNPVNSTFAGVDAGHDLIGQIQYDDEHNQVRSTDLRGNIGVVEMDALRRVVKALSPRADRAPGWVPSAAEGDPVAEIHYNPLVSANGPEWALDPLGYETRYLYDNAGILKEVLQEYDKESTPALYQSVKYGFNTDGLASTVTLTRTPVDEDGEIVGAGPRKETTSHVYYDALDRPKLMVAGEGSGKEIHRGISYTSTGLPWQARVRDDIATDRWQVTSSVYDAMGRVTKQILPEVQDAITHSNAAPQFETTYGPDGSVQSVSDAYGNVTSFLYDVLGNSSQTLGPLVRDVRSGLGTRPASSQRYDAAGRTVAVTDPLARTWDYRWDAAGRLRASLGPLMNPSAEEESQRRAVTSYNPSLTGEDEIIDAEGHRTFITYDATGQVRQTRSRVTSVASSGSSAEGDLIEKITRDLMARVVSTEDGEGHLTGFTYDGMGRQISRTWDPDDPARMKTETASYDAMLRTGRQDAKGQETTFQYDSRFMLERVMPTDKPAEELEYIRDDLGRVTGVNAPDGVSGMGNADCSYAYDALGRLSSEVSNGKTTSYGYDLNGLPRSITNSQNGRELRMTHDAAGRVTSLQDILSGVTRTTGFGYDVGGRLLREDLANGLVETSSYDRMGRLSAKQLRTPDWNVLCGSLYTYDFNSNVTSLRETTGPLAVPSRTVTMAYDERGRLLEEQQTGAVERTERHGYDLADNRVWTRKSEGAVLTARDYEYGSAANSYNSNQLASFAEQVGMASPVTTSYSYDGNGNRTQRSRGGQSDTYVYDSFDRLVEMTLGTAATGNGTYGYAYDYASRRIGREVPGGAQRNFAFAGSSPALEWTPGPGAAGLTENIGGGVGGRLYSYESGSPTWDFHDARGDLLGQTSSSGTLIYRALNDSSGRAVAHSGSKSGRYGANSKWEEPGGMVNDGFRYRDLDAGIFINRDPAGFIDGLNVYNYVGHNPWSMFDANGLSTTGEMLRTDPGFVKHDMLTDLGHDMVGLIGQLGAQEVANKVLAAHQAAYLARLAESELVSPGGVQLPPTALQQKTFDAMQEAVLSARSDLGKMLRWANLDPYTTQNYIADATMEGAKWISQGLQPIAAGQAAEVLGEFAHGATIAAEQNSPASKRSELFWTTLDLPMHAAAGAATWVTKVDASTGMAFEWRGWRGEGGGFGLRELGSFERSFAVFDAFSLPIPEGRMIGAAGMAGSGERLAYNEFRAINAGRFTRADLKVAWEQYKTGQAGKYLTRKPTSLERFFFDNRNFDAVRASRGGASGLTFEHLFIMQKSFDNSAPSILRGLGNSGWNSGLLISRSLNSSLGNNFTKRMLFRGGVVVGAGAAGYGGFWVGQQLGNCLSGDK